MSFYFKSFLLLNENRNLGNGVNIVGFKNGILVYIGWKNYYNKER